MKPPSAWPRQPFVGLALAADAGILVADVAPNHSLALAPVIGLLEGAALVMRRSLAVYALVAAAFFYGHSVRTSDSP
ncbi:MAG: hypothetical protein M3N12_06275, partial [Verrucomicrobiota bacterium]|nr:hypothetical protein [Verrucomicrobiota bacterium]